MHGTDDIDQTRGHGLYHGDAILFVAQGGLELEEGAIVGHIQRVQRQVVDADPGGDIQTVLLCALQRGQGAGGGDLVGVIAGPRHFDQGDVAVQPHAFSHGRDGRQPAQRREFTRGHRRPLAQDGFLRVRDDKRAKATGIGQRAGEHFGIRHHAITIGKAHGTGIHEKPDLCHLAAFAALGQRSHGHDVDRRGLVRTAGDEFKHFGAVDGGVGVGAGDHCRDPTRSRCQPRRAEAFLVPLPGFTNLDAQIDDTGGQVFPTAIHDLRIPGDRCGIVQYRRDLAILDPKRAAGDGACFGVDQLRVDKMQGHGGAFVVRKTGVPRGQSERSGPDPHHHARHAKGDKQGNHGDTAGHLGIGFWFFHSSHHRIRPISTITAKSRIIPPAPPLGGDFGVISAAPV